MGLTLWVSVTIPEYMQKSIDLVTESSTADNNLLQEYLFIIMGLSIALILFRTMSRTLFFNPGRLVEKEIKGDMYKKLSSLGKEFYDKHKTGAISSIVNNDITGIRLIAGFGLMQIVNIIFSLSLTPYKMWELSPELTLYCMIPVLVVFVIIRVGMVVMVKSMHLRMSALQSLSSKIVMYLSGSSVIKSYDMHSIAESDVKESNVVILNQTLKIAFIRAFVLPLLNNLELILKIIVVAVGGLYVINGLFTIGEFTAYLAYATLLTLPIMGLGWVITIFQQGIVSISSVQTIMDVESDIDTDHTEKEHHEDDLLANGLRVENLSYKFHDGENDVIKNVNFDIKPGEVIGITGSVGSGKSTLINCLTKYLTPESGQIFFGQNDINDISNNKLRKAIRVVTQDVFLFSDSIENNIKFGSSEMKQTISIDKAIHMSSLTDEITRFPDKVDTLVGEKGIMLSGGQKLRITLARALYTPCSLLILDDVFSAVDTKTERFLIDQIFGHTQAKSMIIISNRISVLEKTDKIIVLEDGKIEASGVHADVINKSSFYAQAVKLQSKG